MTVVDTELNALLRLRISTEPDPSTLPHLLGYFQNQNITPRKVLAEFATTGLVHIQIDVCGVSENRLSLIAAKIAQRVPVHNAYWHRL